MLILGPVGLVAQSTQTIARQQCVWHTGDNLGWATPSFDDSDWQSWQTWKPQFTQPRLWVRCHLDPVVLRADAQPAIQVTSYSAYQLYLNGVLLGAEGNLRNGNSSLDAIRSYAAPADCSPPGRLSSHSGSPTV